MSCITQIEQRANRITWQYDGIPCEVETELPLLQVTEFINQLDPETMQEFYVGWNGRTVDGVYGEQNN